MTLAEQDTMMMNNHTMDFEADPVRSNDLLVDTLMSAASSKRKPDAYFREYVNDHDFEYGRGSEEDEDLL